MACERAGAGLGADLSLAYRHRLPDLAGLAGRHRPGDGAAVGAGVLVLLAAAGAVRADRPGGDAAGAAGDLDLVPSEDDRRAAALVARIARRLAPRDAATKTGRHKGLFNFVSSRLCGNEA